MNGCVNCSPWARNCNDSNCTWLSKEEKENEEYKEKIKRNETRSTAQYK